MIIETKPCLLCRETSQLKVDQQEYERWKGGELIQRAMPFMPADQRELLISGIHPACWLSIFSEEE